MSSEPVAREALKEVRKEGAAAVDCASELKIIRGFEGLRKVLEEMRKERAATRKVLVMGLAAFFGRAAEVVRFVNPDLLVVLRVPKDDPFYTEEYDAIYCGEGGIDGLPDEYKEVKEELRRFADEVKDERIRKVRGERMGEPFIRWREIRPLIENGRYVEIERTRLEGGGFELFSDVRKVLLMVDEALKDRAEKYVDITNFPLMGRIASVLVASTIPDTKVIYLRSSRDIKRFSLSIYGPLVLEEGSDYIYVNYPTLDVDELTRTILLAMYLLVRREVGEEESLAPPERRREVREEYLSKEIKSTEIRDLLLGEIELRDKPVWWDAFLERSRRVLRIEERVQKMKEKEDGRREDNVKRNVGIGISNKLHDLEKMGLLRVQGGPTRAKFTEFGYEIAKADKELMDVKHQTEEE